MHAGTGRQQGVNEPGIGHRKTTGACEPLPVRSKLSLFMTIGPAGLILQPAPMAAASCTDEHRW
jgi:hypothetical protein